jgi:hypothetical protein
MSELAFAVSHLSPAGNPAPPRPANSRRFYGLDDGIGRPFFEDLNEGSIAPHTDILLDRFRIDDPAFPQHDLFLLGVKRDPGEVQKVRVTSYKNFSFPELGSTGQFSEISEKAKVQSRRSGRPGVHVAAAGTRKDKPDNESRGEEWRFGM